MNTWQNTRKIEAGRFCFGCQIGFLVYQWLSCYRHLQPQVSVRNITHQMQILNRYAVNKVFIARGLLQYFLADTIQYIQRLLQLLTLLDPFTAGSRFIQKALNFFIKRLQ